MNPPLELEGGAVARCFVPQRHIKRLARRFELHDGHLHDDALVPPAEVRHDARRGDEHAAQPDAARVDDDADRSMKVAVLPKRARNSMSISITTLSSPLPVKVRRFISARIETTSSSSVGVRTCVGSPPGVTGSTSSLSLRDLL